MAAKPERKIIQILLVALATPITTPAMEMIPSLAPSTPARKMFKRPAKFESISCVISDIVFSFLSIIKYRRSKNKLFKLSEKSSTILIIAIAITYANI